MLSAKSDVQVDTAEVRVTEWRLAPGSATGHHIHEMDYVIVMAAGAGQRHRPSHPRDGLCDRAGHGRRDDDRGPQWRALEGAAIGWKILFPQGRRGARRAQRDGFRDRVPRGRAETVAAGGPDFPPV